MWHPALLVIVIFVLLVGVALVPWRVAELLTGMQWQGPAQVADAVRSGLVTDWTRQVSVPGEGSSALADAAAFWRWFHIAKAALAAVLLAATGAAVVVTWDARRAQRHTWKRLGLAAATVAGSALFAVSLLVVIANIQGAVAPLSSVLSFLSTGHGDGEFVSVILALRENVAGAELSNTAQVIVRDFSVYHATVAVLLGATTLAAACAVWICARGRQWLAVGSLVAMVLVFGLLTFANTGTALHPVPAFTSFLVGAAT